MGHDGGAPWCGAVGAWPRMHMMAEVMSTGIFKWISSAVVA